LAILKARDYYDIKLRDLITNSSQRWGTTFMRTRKRLNCLTA